MFPQYALLCRYHFFLQKWCIGHLSTVHVYQYILGQLVNWVKT